MNGMNATTGQAIDGNAHLAQSIIDILSTPIGARVMRRDYGSLLFDLVDQPINAALPMLMRAAAALAIRKWEPRLALRKIRIASDAPALLAAGSLTISIEGDRTDLPAPNARVSLSIPIRLGGAVPLTS